MRERIRVEAVAGMSERHEYKLLILSKFIQGEDSPSELKIESLVSSPSQEGSPQDEADATALR